MPGALAREVCHETDVTVVPRATQEKRQTGRSGVRVGLPFAALFVIAIFVWQGIAAHGSPDPLRANTSATVASLDIGVLVFREGLECILVLAAVTATMTGPRLTYRRPVMSGAAIAFLTGLLAVIVLLVIMNWFFHKIYWGGWIRAHNRRRKSLLDPATTSSRLRWGLILLGFTSLYREGFEVVLFLQSYHLRLGGDVVLKGTLLGLTLTGMVALLTFVLQQRLPYRKMLITTGILLGVVLLVMVGEQAQEMQLANWISTTPIPWLEAAVPPWMSLWFAIFPTYETMAAQFLAALLVIGSYFAAKRFGAVPLAGSDSVEEAKRVSVSASVVNPLEVVR